MDCKNDGYIITKAILMDDAFLAEADLEINFGRYRNVIFTKIH